MEWSEWSALVRQLLPEFAHGNPCAVWLLFGVALTIGMRLLNYREIARIARDQRALKRSESCEDESDERRS